MKTQIAGYIGVFVIIIKLIYDVLKYIKWSNDHNEDSGGVLMWVLIAFRSVTYSICSLIAITGIFIMILILCKWLMGLAN